MTDYGIEYRPERKKLVKKTEDGEETIGFQIEGHTSFIFSPPSELSNKEEFKNILEDILSEKRYEWSKNAEGEYYRVMDKVEDSFFHLAIEKKEHIALFVQVNTTEKSVRNFHEKLLEISSEDWTIEKNETDITGTGANP